MLIRQEGKTDYKRIRELNDAAFGSTEESQLIDSLRTEGQVLLSLVAEEERDIIGHILFSRIHIDSGEGGPKLPVAALAPMCVSSVHQKKGVGGALIQQGLRMLKQRGEKAVFVVGHKLYYPKFGFSNELASHFDCEYSGDSFFAHELQPGWMEGKTGTVHYPESFRRLS
jgi:putative acetyltransferase